MSFVSKGNGKSFLVTSHEEREEMVCWASSLTLTFGTTQMAEFSRPRAGRTDTNIQKRLSNAKSAKAQLT
jgi:hypothetical protein